MTRPLSPRRAALLTAIEAEDGDWTASRAWHFYRATGRAPGRRTARHDLQILASAGHLDRHDEPARRHYTLRETTP